MQDDSIKIYLAATNIIFTVMGVLGIAPALMSFMLFDAPGSSSNPTIVTLFWGLLTFPLVCVLSVVLSQRLYKVRQYFLACGIASLPLVNIFIIFSVNS